MPLPFFYTQPISSLNKIVVLNEDNSKHIVQVLRMQAGEVLQLTDGKGNLYFAKIAEAHKKNCSVNIIQSSTAVKPAKDICLAVSLVKNNTRFEWLLEKATEIGVTQIVPLLCARTEKQHFRYERMQGILVSAMLQSQQVWLPVLHEPVKFTQYISHIKNTAQQKFIAHCEENEKLQLSSIPLNNNSTKLMLIGPEGDFTKEEIVLAVQNDFTPVSLGNTRLRTETAAIVAAVLLAV